MTGTTPARWRPRLAGIAAALLLSASAAQGQTTARTLTLTNNCSESIWVAAAGNTGACTPSNNGQCMNPPSCVSANDCPLNEYCVTPLHQSTTSNACSSYDCATVTGQTGAGGLPGGCPPGVNNLGSNTETACSDANPCASGETCVAATNTCWTLGPVGCFCDESLPTPACAFRQCTYVPLGGTQVTTQKACVSNIHCGVPIKAGTACSSTNPCTGAHQYCNPNTLKCVWFGGELPSDTACTSDTDCSGPLEYCNSDTSTCWKEQFCNASTGTCAFVATDGNTWELEAPGSGSNAASVTVPVTWAGRFWARTGCENDSGSFTCNTGTCTGMVADGSGNAEFSESCEVSGNPPVTAAEFALGITFPNGNTTDYYDVSMTDSANLAVSIVPDSSTYDMSSNGGIATTGGSDGAGSCTQDSDCPSPQANAPGVAGNTYNWQCDTGLGKCVNAYQCGSPGCTDTAGCAASGIDASLVATCPWDGSSGSGFAVSASDCQATVLGNSISSLAWSCVGDGVSDCGNGSDSPDGGSYAGCLGADIACSENTPADLNCNGQPQCETDSDCVTSTAAGITGTCTNGVCTSSPTTAMTQLYGCTGGADQGATSCYTMGAPASDSDFCCGCASWSPLNNNGNSSCALEPGSETESFSNTEWVNNSEPIAKIFHDACPQAYAFPFDDFVSTFTCSTTVTTSNVNYEVTFCPQLAPAPSPTPPGDGACTAQKAIQGHPDCAIKKVRPQGPPHHSRRVASGG